MHNTIKTNNSKEVTKHTTIKQQTAQNKESGNKRKHKQT